jgi:hypothetical protein
VITLAALHVYPVKSCRGAALRRAALTEAGLAHDREWMVATPAGRFLTQRELPRLALVEPRLDVDALHLAAPGAEPLRVPFDAAGDSLEVTVWHDRCLARDQGDEAAGWLTAFLGREARLVRFDPARHRYSDAEWTGGMRAQTRFSDGYAMLAVSEASLADLNSRLPQPLPMERFRPSLVLDGLPAYGEDELVDLWIGDDVHLRVVKPCTRCVVTTTNQQSGEVEGDEPLRTLRSYRWNAELRGIVFGQNVIVISGAGAELSVGQAVRTRAASR